VLQRLLEEAIPVSDLNLILEEVSTLNVQKMQSTEIAEALRPKLIPLLIQRLIKFKDTLPLVTFAANLEQLILTSVRQNSDEKMLIIDGGLAKKILSGLNDVSESLSAQGKPTFLIVAPQIRRHVSKFVRAQLPSINVLSFTELPENRNVEIVQTIGEQEQIADQGDG
jgi:flagellar biosynthesis protein FlhA